MIPKRIRISHWAWICNCGSRSFYGSVATSEIDWAHCPLLNYSVTPTCAVGNGSERRSWPLGRPLCLSFQVLCAVEQTGLKASNCLTHCQCQPCHPPSSTLVTSYCALGKLDFFPRVLTKLFFSQSYSLLSYFIKQLLLELVQDTYKIPKL